MTLETHVNRISRNGDSVVASAYLRRLLEVVLPDGGGVMALYEGYFDESGSFEEEPHVFCVAGYYFASEQAVILDSEWAKVLTDHHLPYFHMVDCAHGSGVFADKSISERIEIQTKLINLIKAHAMSGFAIIAQKKKFEIGEAFPDEYSACVEMSVLALKSFLETFRLKGDVAYFFETGHKNKGSAYNHIAAQLARTSSSITFAEKTKVRLLQAADLLAWQTSKYAKDKLANKRQPRRDFLSLMDLPHILNFLSIEGKNIVANYESWPVKARFGPETAYKLESNELFTYYRDAKGGPPIILVEETVGTRMAPGWVSEIKFKGLNQKEFVLGFEEIRLHEALVTFIGALQKYTRPDNIPALIGRHTEIIVAGGRAFLRVHLAPDLVLNIALTEHAFKSLVAATQDVAKKL